MKDEECKQTWGGGGGGGGLRPADYTIISHLFLKRVGSVLSRIELTTLLFYVCYHMYSLDPKRAQPLWSPLLKGGLQNLGACSAPTGFEHIYRVIPALIKVSSKLSTGPPKFSPRLSSFSD